MSYPTLEQYNEALQYPQNALTDPILKTGKIATTGLGLPQALCGGFALTYTITTTQNKFAVRCFHKQSKNLEQRYSAVSKKIKQLNSSYFLNFEFQSNGVRVGGNSYPVVKMAWAKGETLASFVEKNYKNKIALQNLNSSLASLSKYLHSVNVAHGDIQPENLMISESGKVIQLIDYDGMYVDDIKSLGSAELGQRNFQHPKRNSSNWDSTLDRFSFISLNLSLRALEKDPNLWVKTQSDQAAILFRANDYQNPESVNLFRELMGKPDLSDDVKNFISICKSPIDKVPTLEDYLSRKNIPVAIVKLVTTPTQPQQYISAYQVVDANNYSACLSMVGDVVELIGQIVEVKKDRTRHGNSYVFVNFGHWQGKTTKLNIWSEGLATLQNIPTEAWVGKWVSVIGLMEPPYVNRRFKYEHLAITITQNNQIKIITQQEAHFRLKGVTNKITSKNQSIYSGIRGEKTLVTQSKPYSSNAAVLASMKSKSGSQRSYTNNRTHSSKSNYSYKTSNSRSSNCFVATAVYEDIHHPKVQLLRKYRDEVLRKNFFGIGFIKIYYSVGPYLAIPVKRNQKLKLVLKKILDVIVRRIEKTHPSLING